MIFFDEISASQNTTWIIAYAIAVVWFICGISYVICSKKRLQRSAIYTLIVSFLSISFLIYPNELLIKNYTPAEAVFSSILFSINSIKGTPYAQISISEMPHFSVVYSFTLLFIQFIGVLATLSTILVFFTKISQGLRIIMNRKKKLVLFSEPNSKCIAIAKSMGFSHSVPVFANVSKLSEEVKDLFIGLNAICLPSRLDKIISKIKNRKFQNMEVFLFSDSDNTNLELLSNITKELHQRKSKSTINIHTELSEVSWDEQNNFAIQHKPDPNITISFFRVDDTFALNNLYENSIFEHYVEDSKHIKNINLLFIGVDKFTEAMIKTAMTLGQMPGYFVNLLVIDDKAGYESFKSGFPMIEDHVSQQGYAAYSFTYCENIDFDANQLEELINFRMPRFTFAFINLADDYKNHNLAARLNGLRSMEDRINGYMIQVMDKNEIKWEIQNECYMNMKQVGWFDQLYSYSNIVSNKIDATAQALYKAWCENKTNVDQAEWSTYSSDEYKRRSDYHRALSLKHKIEIIDKDYKKNYSLLTDSKLWAEYEHMRWNVYTQSTGFVYGPKRDDIAKVHNCIMAFEKLPDTVQKYDYTGNEAILTMLKNK